MAQQITPLFPTDEEFISTCLSTGKSPKELIDFLEEFKKTAPLWNLAHIETGVLSSTQQMSYNGSTVLILSWKAKDYLGNPVIKSARTGFLTDPNEIAKYTRPVGTSYKFYISYTKGKDGRQFRRLIDIDNI